MYTGQSVYLIISVLMINMVCVQAFSGETMLSLPREHLGDGVFAQAAMWVVNTLHLTTVDNMRVGRGQGENFTHWRKADNMDGWRKTVLFPSHNPGMSSMLPLNEDAILFLYVDRKEESARRVYLVLVAENETRVLFEFEGGSGVLNPNMDLLGNGDVHLLIPDRTDLNVRRFVINIATGASERLPDVVMPRRGARIYDRIVLANRLIVPVSVVEEMVLMVIELDTHDYALYSVDRFDSIAGEPPRMTSIFSLGDADTLALVYMRPASFSDRPGKEGPRTGLLGEIVCNIVNMATWERMASTVIAGFKAEAAATHNMAVLQTGRREFLLAHTEVDRIHERHLTGVYENYVGGFVTRWRIGDDHVPQKDGEYRLPPFFSTRLAPGGPGTALLVCNEAREGDPLYLYRIDIERMP